jgi:hypothetical protein
MKSSRPWRYASAITVDELDCLAANPDKQYYSVIPESTYCSMQLSCERCNQSFWFTANEQKLWYEQWGFWIDSVPNECAACRRITRETKGQAEQGT